jgi:hypothetical protein
MDTDERPDLRRGGAPPYILKAETEKIIGFAFEVLNYLRITKLRVGLLLNFKKPRLEFERVVL